MIINLIIAFNLGLFSSLHCVGMCGGFISSLMLVTSDTKEINKPKKIILKNSFAYNFGRIISYTIAGLLMGLFGLALTELLAQFNIHFVLQLLASIILISIALNILGIFQLSMRLESIGMTLWKRAQPLAKGLLPVDNFIKAFLFGMVWGWLPCGIVYSALLFSLTTGSALNGMLIMLCFGLGTLPTMISAGYFIEYLNQFRQHKQLRWFTATMLILIAVAIPLSMTLMQESHEGHQHQVEQVGHSADMHH